MSGISEAGKKHLDSLEESNRKFDQEAIAMLYQWLEERKAHQTDFPQDLPFPKNMSEAKATKLEVYFDGMPKDWKESGAYCLNLADIARVLKVNEGHDGPAFAESDWVEKNWLKGFSNGLTRFMVDWMDGSTVRESDAVCEFVEEEAWGPLLHLLLDTQKWIDLNRLKIVSWHRERKLTLYNENVDELQAMLKSHRGGMNFEKVVNGYEVDVDRIDRMIKLIDNLS